jgi:8-oxo-dGTP pyrophosphatase MutT (NUDIX family)
MALTFDPVTLPFRLDEWGTIRGLPLCVAVLVWHPDGGHLATVTRKEDGSKVCLPGGKCDYRDFGMMGRCPATQDILRRAAARELREETGLDVPTQAFAFLWGTSDYADGKKFTATMWAMPGDHLTRDIKGEPGTEALWLTPACLASGPEDYLTKYPKAGAFPDYYRKLFTAIGVRSDGAW